MTRLPDVSPDDFSERGPGPLAAESSSSEEPVRNYDVFVNHRGPDVKRTLISHLSGALKTVNFTCFVDNEEIQVGDTAAATIKSAIQHSKVHISVFSPGYAESAWCLDELLSIMEHRREERTDLFLPVFFNVTPSDLRLLTASRESCYNSAFENHGTRYEAILISNWKKALHEASKVKGYIFPEDFQGYEGRLVESIVSKVIEVLSRATLLHGPEHPVGLNETLQEALDCMKRGKPRSGCQKLGIYGMGGLGKTTLAKSIFNRIHREFESACFMQSVSEASKNTRKGLTGLQQDMLQELLKTHDISVPNCARGKQMMRDRLEGKKVLIILDDVSEKEQLDQLMPPYDCHLGMGSQIVITTRDLQVLRWANADETCLPMEGLPRKLAFELFNLHAFHSTKEPPKDVRQPQEEPSRDLKELAEKVADACDGLPLALEVLGSYLRGRGIFEWENTVKVLEARNKMISPQKQVTAILKLSFDALFSPEEKEMFLDIACFLVHEPKDKAMRIWRSEFDDAAAELYLQTLICKCLVKVDENGELTMHDLLCDMGREIVDNSQKDYWERSHLWREDDVRRVLQKRKGTSHVRALSSKAQKEWDTMSLTGMDELKLLVFSNVTLTGDYSKLPQELRWFQLRYCPLEAPLSLNLDYVAVLDLEGSKLTSFNCVNHMFQNLKELNLGNCSNLKELPFEFGKSCNNLEILILHGCVNLEKMPDSIGELRSSLRYLDMSQCSKLTSLPNGITNLRALITLLMNHCGGLIELSDLIGQLTALEKIGLDGLPLGTLPESFGSLSNLVSLRLDHLSKLRELPSTIGELTKLTSLDIISCPLISEIPPGVTELTNLVRFCVSDCNSVSQLPTSIGDLRRLVELHVCGIVKLNELPSSIGQLHKLKVLCLQSCANLRSVENLPFSLTSLDVGGCTSLRTLDMSGCSELKALPDGLECLCCLSYIDISRCGSLVDLPSVQLEKLTSLKRLRLARSGVSVVQDNRSPWIQKMVSLEEVIMRASLRRDYFDEDFLEEYQEGFSLKAVVQEGDIACRGVLCLCFVVPIQRLTFYHFGVMRAVPLRNVARAVVVGKGEEGEKFSQEFWASSQPVPVREPELCICIFRASHPFVDSLKGGDTIHVRTLFQRSSMIGGVLKLMYGEREMEEALQRLTLGNSEAGKIITDIRVDRRK